MRLLHLTDTHLGTDRWFVGSPKGWRRSDDHRDAMAAALLADPEPDVIVHSGDLFDRSRPAARAVAEAVELLTEAARRAPVLLVPGNHDWRGLRPYLGHVPGLQIADEPLIVDVRGVRIGLVHYYRQADEWAAAARSLVERGVDPLVCHQSFDGARAPGITFRAGVQPETVGVRHLPRGLSHVLCGHLHGRQVTRVGECAIVQPGSTERTSFVEHREVKGAAVWELGPAVSHRFVPTPARPMRPVDGPEGLMAVQDGDLVRLEGAMRGDEGEAAVRARGGWVAPWRGRPEPRQQRLAFG